MTIDPFRLTDADLGLEPTLPVLAFRVEDALWPTCCTEPGEAAAACPVPATVSITDLQSFLRAHMREVTPPDEVARKARNRFVAAWADRHAPHDYTEATP